MSGIAIIDAVCPRPYTTEMAANGALGGTEATVARIAEGLDADVYQHNRDRPDGRYKPLPTLRDADALIVLRDPKVAVAWSDRLPHAKVVVWMHDLIEPGRDRARRLATHAGRLAERNACVVGVSDFHAHQIDAALAASPHRPRVTRVYNPLRSGLDAIARRDVDRDRLIYFSSPTKGLAFANFVFPALRRRWPRMQLLVAMPEYAPTMTHLAAGVTNLGAVSQVSLLEQVAGALCSFCPNFEYPETFGLALAESNAVGTPVLAHPIGAAPEVLDDPRQLMPVPRLASAAYRLARRYGLHDAWLRHGADRLRGFDGFVSRIEAWRDGGRPVVAARADFDHRRVLEEWRALLASMPSR